MITRNGKITPEFKKDFYKYYNERRNLGYVAEKMGIKQTQISNAFRKDEEFRDEFYKYKKTRSKSIPVKYEENVMEEIKHGLIDATQLETDKRFIEGLMEKGTITGACKYAGVGNISYYRNKIANDAEFQMACKEAVNSFLDDMEEVGMKRGKDGSDALMKYFLDVKRYGRGNVTTVNITFNPLTGLNKSELDNIVELDEYAIE